MAKVIRTLLIIKSPSYGLDDEVMISYDGEDQTTNPSMLRGKELNGISFFMANLITNVANSFDAYDNKTIDLARAERIDVEVKMDDGSMHRVVTTPVNTINRVSVSGSRFCLMMGVAAILQTCK